MATSLRYLVRTRPALLAAGLASAAHLAAGQSVGVGTATPSAKAALEIAAADKGLLIPRLDSTQRVAISAPPDGLMVFQKNGRVGLWYAFGGAWLYIPDKVKAGDNLGNHTATRPLQLNDQPLTNHGTGGLRLTDAGNVGIGTSTPTAPLEVAGITYLGTYGPNLTPTAAALVASSTAPAPGGQSFAVSNVTDGNNTTVWRADVSSPVTQPQWLRAQLAQPKVVRRYGVMSQGPQAADSWQLQGSQDATTWTTLHAANNVTPRQMPYSATLPNTTAYPYYRLYITRRSGTSSTSGVTVAEWSLYEENQALLTTRLGPGSLQLGGGATVQAISDDGGLVNNSPAILPTQRAVKAYVDSHGDDLGDHTATQTLKLNGNLLSNTAGTGGLRFDNTGNGTFTNNLSVAGSAQLGWTLVERNTNIAGNVIMSITLTCPAGMRVLGGGGGHRDFNSAAGDIIVNYTGPDPSAPDTQWRVILDNTNSSGRAVRAYCTCARIAP